MLGVPFGKNTGTKMRKEDILKKTNINATKYAVSIKTFPPNELYLQ